MGHDGDFFMMASWEVHVNVADLTLPIGSRSARCVDGGGRGAEGGASPSPPPPAPPIHTPSLSLPLIVCAFFYLESVQFARCVV